MLNVDAGNLSAQVICAVRRLLRPGGSRLVLAGDPKQLGPVTFLSWFFVLLRS